MVHSVGQRVLFGESAPVVRRFVDPIALHPPLAGAAEEQSAQDVWVVHALQPPSSLAPTSAREHFLDLREVLGADDRRMHDLVGPHPLLV